MSGHAVMIAALAGVVTPYLPGRWKVVPWVLVGLVMIARVYVGAHNPLDVLCGAALGVAIAGAVNLVLKPAPARRRAKVPSDPRARPSGIAFRRRRAAVRGRAARRGRAEPHGGGDRGPVAPTLDPVTPGIEQHVLLPGGLHPHGHDAAVAEGRESRDGPQHVPGRNGRRVGGKSDPELVEREVVDGGRRRRTEPGGVEDQAEPEAAKCVERGPDQVRPRADRSLGDLQVEAPRVEAAALQDLLHEARRVGPHHEP